MKLEIKLLTNEGFFGGAINDGICMPYGLNEFERDLREWHSGNQASSTLISNKGRYVYSEFPFKIISKQGKIILESEHEIVFKTNGTSLKSAYSGLKNDFFKNDGKTPNLLMFERPQYNTRVEMEWYCTQEKVIKYAKSIIENGYPTGVLMIDDCWCKDYGVWQFAKENFPNPKDMIDELHEMGFTVMLWCCPFISPDSESFRYLEPKGLLVKNENGDTAISHWWNGFSAVLDLSIPEARQYFLDICKNLQNEYGVDGFKMDAGDPDYYHKGFVFNDKTEKSFQAHQWAKMGEEFGFNELRVAFNNQLKGVAHRLRDKNHSWNGDGIDMLIPNALAMGLCGYPYLCPDMIGGGMILDFHRDGFVFDEELFVRYAQISALFPMMQFSTLPWKVLSEENEKIVYETVILHEKYSNIIKSLAIEASKEGFPIIRHMLFEFDDDRFLNIDDQFMLGNCLMVAPQTTKGNRRNVVIPDGIWLDELGNEYKKGSYDIDVPLNRIPMFRRK